jgi:hypothetical protein
MAALWKDARLSSNTCDQEEQGDIEEGGDGRGRREGGEGEGVSPVIRS